MQQSTLVTNHTETVQEPLGDLPEISRHVPIPAENWQGPVTADGEPFHDMGVQTQVGNHYTGLLDMYLQMR